MNHTENETGGSGQICLYTTFEQEQFPDIASLAQVGHTEQVMVVLLEQNLWHNT